MAARRVARRAERREASRADAWRRTWEQVECEGNLSPDGTDWDAVEAARDLAKTDAAAWFAAMQALAEQGCVVAMVDVGLALVHGIGVASDPDRALIWLRRAAEADPTGQYFLGRTCLWLKLDEEARGAMEAAAAKGFVPAQIYAGFMHETGRGGPADQIKATAYYEAALRRGSVAAKLMLGRRLLTRWWNPVAAVRGLALLSAGVWVLVDHKDQGKRTDPTVEEFSWWALPIWIGILVLVSWGPHARAADFWWMAPLACAVLVAVWIVAARGRAREREQRLSAWPFRPDVAGRAASGAKRP